MRAIVVSWTSCNERSGGMGDGGFEGRLYLSFLWTRKVCTRALPLLAGSLLLKVARHCDASMTYSGYLSVRRRLAKMLYNQGAVPLFVLFIAARTFEGRIEGGFSPAGILKLGRTWAKEACIEPLGYRFHLTGTAESPILFQQSW